MVGRLSSRARNAGIRFRARLVMAATVGAVVVGAAASGTFAASSLAAQHGHAKASHKLITIRLALNNSASSIVPVVAQKEGFFAKEGLKANETVLTDISKVEPALGHQFDIGFAVPPIVLAAYAHGIKIVEVAADEQSTPSDPVVQLFARADEHIKSPADIAGKTISGPTLTGTLNIATLEWLKQHKVTVDPSNEVQVTDPLEVGELQAGKVDVSELQPPFIVQAKKAGLVPVGYPMSVIGNPASMAFWAASQSWAKSHLSVIAKFKAALTLAEAYMAKHQQATYKIIANYTKAPLKVVEASPIEKYGVQPKVTDISSWAKVMKEQSGFNAPLNYAKMIVTSK